MRRNLVLKSVFIMFMIALPVILILSLLGLFPQQGRQNGRSFEPRVIRGVNTTNIQSIAVVRHQYKGNALRYYLRPKYLAEKNHVSEREGWEIALNGLENFLKQSAASGMAVIIDLHEVPFTAGFQGSPDFWTDKKNLQILTECWEEIVLRFTPYRDYIWGYDLLNEPDHDDANVWPSWAREIIKQIRKSDRATPVIFEPSPVAVPASFMEEKGAVPVMEDDKMIYSIHMYQPRIYTQQGLDAYNKAPFTDQWPDQYTYPGKIGDLYWDKQQIRKVLQPVRDFQVKYGVPIYVGEFSAIRWAKGSAQYIRDCIEIFEEYGWNWTFHAFADWQGWDVHYTDAMTSDANAKAAVANEPTDRALVLKHYFARNTFLPPK